MENLHAADVKKMKESWGDYSFSTSLCVSLSGTIESCALLQVEGITNWCNSISPHMVEVICDNLLLKSVLGIGICNNNTCIANNGPHSSPPAHQETD
jgi:hypothetical protein